MLSSPQPPDWVLGHPASYQCVPGALSLGQIKRKVKLTTLLHLVPRLRMRGAVPPFPCMSSWLGA
jgi:hypothetical protein